MMSIITRAGKKKTVRLSEGKEEVSFSSVKRIRKYRGRLGRRERITN